MFCTERDLYERLAYREDCAILTGNLNHFKINDFLVLFIPCNFRLADAGYGCDFYMERISSHEIHEPEPTFCSESVYEYEDPIKRFYPCRDGTFLLHQYICDGHINCVHGDDEDNCTGICQFHNYVRSMEITDCYTNCHPTNCTCIPMYFQCQWKMCSIKQNL